MITPERRHHPRQQAEIGVTVRKNSEKIPATMIDMSEGGVAIIAGQELPPGTNVKITVNFVDDYYICGTVKWAQLHAGVENNIMYRIGIAADQIITTEDIL